MIEDDKRAFKGVWICAVIWAQADWSWTEKALLAEIDSLADTNSPCCASNKYLAARIGVSVSRLNSMLSRLQAAGFVVRVKYDGRITHRVVSPHYSGDPGVALKRMSAVGSGADSTGGSC